MKELYLSEIKKLQDCRGLSSGEIAGLTGKLRSGDIATRNRLVESCLLLVVQMAQDLYSFVPERSCLTLEDLIQEGNLGLFKALEHYDEAKGRKFSTHAFDYIKNAIKDLIDEYSVIVHVPFNLLHDNRRIMRAEGLLLSRLNRPPTLQELACQTEIDIAKLSSKVWEIANFCNVYLDDPVGRSNEKLTYHDVLPEKLFADRRVKQEEIDYLDYYLAWISSREREVLMRLFGLCGHDAQTAVAIGPKLNMSDERVRQISRDAIAKLQKKIKRDELIVRLKNL